MLLARAGERPAFLYGIFLRNPSAAGNGDYSAIQIVRQVKKDFSLWTPIHGTGFCRETMECDVRAEVLPEPERIFLTGLLTVFRRSMVGHP